MLNGNTIELGVCYYPEHWDTSFRKEDMLRRYIQPCLKQ